MWVKTGSFSESRHLSPPVQESSYGSPLTPPKRPKRKLPSKRRQERPVAAPKKRRRKVHRVDQYAAEARRKKVSLHMFQNFMMEVPLFRHYSRFIFSTWVFTPCFRLGFCRQNSNKCTEGPKGKQPNQTKSSESYVFLASDSVCIREILLYNLLIF